LDVRLRLRLRLDSQYLGNLLQAGANKFALSRLDQPPRPLLCGERTNGALGFLGHRNDASLPALHGPDVDAKHNRNQLQLGVPKRRTVST
jgi:hypothetical protein